MKLKWKGKLSETNSFPENYIPNNATQFLNSNSKIIPYIPVIYIFIIIFIAMYIKRNFIGQFNLDIKGWVIGLILTIPFLIIHEFLHAVCFPKECSAEVFYSPAGISIIPCVPISKLRYAITLAIPAITIGLIPLLAWVFIPFTNITVSSIIFIISIGNLGGTTNDLYNLSQVLKKMPKGSFMITSGTNCYYYQK